MNIFLSAIISFTLMTGGYLFAKQSPLYVPFVAVGSFLVGHFVTN